MDDEALEMKINKATSRRRMLVESVLYGAIVGESIDEETIDYPSLVMHLVMHEMHVIVSQFHNHSLVIE